MNITAHAIAQIYREVLIEALEGASITTTPDAAVRMAIDAAFSANVPTTLGCVAPEGVPLVVTVRAEAASLLHRICLQLPLPREKFVEHVAIIARRITGI